MRFQNIEAKAVSDELEKLNITNTIIDDLTIDVVIEDITRIQHLINLYTFTREKSELEIIRDTQSQIVLSLVMGGLM